jgi:hypothetical protein
MRSNNPGRTSVGIIITVLTLAGWLMACGLVRVHTYLIPAKMAPRWITIEYDNPRCAPLWETAFGREFVIPESGFLCTSSVMYKGWHREQYYLIDENNNQTALRVDERIFRRESFHINEPSSQPGMAVCNLTGEEFFYGPKEKLAYENPIRQDESFLTQYHPECRRRDSSVKPTP